MKKVPGIFRELFLCSCQRGSRAMAFLWFFIFPETASRYSMMLGGFGEEGMGRAVLAEQGKVTRFSSRCFPSPVFSFSNWKT